MLEFLFCPIHGIFGANNIAWVLAYGGNLLVEAKFWGEALVRMVARCFQKN